MTLPEKDHPVWKIITAIIAFGGMFTWLFLDGTHNKDMQDASGVAGGVGSGVILKSIIDKLWS